MVSTPSLHRKAVSARVRQRRAVSTHLRDVRPRYPAVRKEKQVTGCKGEDMLEIRNVNIKEGRKRIIKDLSLTVREGSIYGLIGENGAGKSTLFKAVAGLRRTDSGDILWNGKSIYENTGRYQKKIAYMPDFFGVYDNLRVVEYMLFFAAIYGLSGREADRRVIYLLEKTGLKRNMNTYVDTLSRGMKQKLMFARCLIHDPDLIILDEPASGMDEASRKDLDNALFELSEKGKSILISSHILDDMSYICTDIGVLEKGRLKMSGSMEEIMKNLNEHDPIYIKIENDTDRAVKILKNNPRVLSISIDKNILMVNFKGTEKDEAELLRELVENEINISAFDRKEENLNKLFFKFVKG